jgi:hypothetical protein
MAAAVLFSPGRRLFKKRFPDVRKKRWIFPGLSPSGKNLKKYPR